MKKALFILLLAAATGCHKAEDSASIAGPEVGVRFVLPGLSADASPALRAAAAATAPETENLAEDVTVRVLAFQRRNGGASADITADTFVAEATYKALADGSLVACNVDPATGAVDAANTATPAEIRLRADSYDFYAITPALPVNKSTWTVSVAHGVDYAVTRSEDIASVQVKPQAGLAPQTVELAILYRKCSKLSFAIDRKTANISKTEIKKVELSQIAPAPTAPVIGQDIAIAATNDGTYTIPADNFTVVNNLDYKLAGYDEVLPKSNGKFKIDMNVIFNGTGSADDHVSELHGEVPEMAFVPGYQYRFNLELRGDFIGLTLIVLPWNVPETENNPELGNWPFGEVFVGGWQIAQWSPSLGGSSWPEIAPDSWTSNPDWGADIGAIPSLPVSNPWVGSDPQNPDIGAL